MVLGPYKLGATIYSLLQTLPLISSKHHMLKQFLSPFDAYSTNKMSALDFLLNDWVLHVVIQRGVLPLAPCAM